MIGISRKKFDDLVPIFAAADGRWCIKKQWDRIPLSPFSQDTATPTRTETGMPRSVIRFMAAIRA
jgi:hypothetical protein